MIHTRPLLCLGLILTLAGCRSSPDVEDKKTDARLEMSGDCAGKQAYAANVLDRSATALMRYYDDSRHLTCEDPKTCENPWYAGHEPNRMVESALRTFPGGTGYEWSSSEAVPHAGEPYEFMPPTDTFDQRTLVEVMRFGADYPVLCFRYEYETNDETGPKARATLRAVVAHDAGRTIFVREVSVDDRSLDSEVSPLHILYDEDVQP